MLSVCTVVCTLKMPSKCHFHILNGRGIPLLVGVFWSRACKTSLTNLWASDSLHQHETESRCKLCLKDDDVVNRHSGAFHSRVLQA